MRLGEKGRQIWPFLLICCLHLVAIFIFTSGFLLTRTELLFFSQCQDIHQSPCISLQKLNESNINEDGESRCWTKPAVNRVVIIIIDALRSDFVTPSLFSDEPRPWMDKLPVLQNIAYQEQSTARIFRAIADPPTTSLQRLKGLTTGSLPTFIDVGRSFGAPVIAEDNLIHQLISNGKRVLMMGDDTWLKVFPDHFTRAYPFPSFNVKDLDTVDNGCVDHLLPALYEDDWDVLIAHFLGVDHAGHIFGVSSDPMIKKLEQYNAVLEKVIEILRNQSGPGALHENTLLIVMGDHGQTLNGDHGGGTPEEVETSLFAMTLKQPLASAASIFNASSCRLSTDGKRICISTFQQLDFSVTIAALMGIPFPFGSLGRVDPELYALAARPSNMLQVNDPESTFCSDVVTWMQNYVDVLCLNSWQVKRYIDVYSASSLIGFPKEDLLHIGELYTQANDGWSKLKQRQFSESKNPAESCENLSVVLGEQIQFYRKFLLSVAELARSKWTEFDSTMMCMGLLILILSLFIHLYFIWKVHKQMEVIDPSFGSSILSSGSMVAAFLVCTRACSFLSNSYILAEGKVANFLLTTTGILNLRQSFAKNKMTVEAISFILLCIILGFSAERGLSKQASNLISLKYSLRTFFSEVGPLWLLLLLTVAQHKNISQESCCIFLRNLVISGTVIGYVLVAVYWIIENDVLVLPGVLKGIEKNSVPQLVYLMGLGLLAVLVLGQMFGQKVETSDFHNRAVFAATSMLSVWSPSLLLIMGRQGPMFALSFILGAWCIIRLQMLSVKGSFQDVLMKAPIYVTQWSLLAVCLFFYTGHWCAFDGLRYGAAFVGFEDFSLIRQGVLLAIDTFGISHIISIFSLPLLVAQNYTLPQDVQSHAVFLKILANSLLIYGLITSVSTTMAMACVTIHRRHLMVWGLFAPKYVFDAVSLMLTDVLIFLATLYYF